MIKILFFIDTLTGGGAEKVLRTLVNNMDQSRFQITVHTAEEEPEAEHLLAPGIRYRSINRCKTPFGKKLFSCWYRLCAQLKWVYPLYIRDDYDIEVAYLECGPTKIIAGSANKRAKKLAWVHCDLEKRPELAAQAETLQKYYRKFHKVVCVAETVKDSYEKLMGTPPETVVLHNVNDEGDILTRAGAFSVPHPGCVTFASLGRLSYEKGNDRLLEACGRLAQEGYGFALWIVGDGAERSALEAQAEVLGLKDRVTFWGFRENPYPYMKTADVIVCPSRYEGFSTVMTEAMILGKAAVTTPCSGMKEILGDCQYGIITEDSPDGLYEGMKRLLEDPVLRQQYADAAALRGKDFSKAKVVEETQDFLESLVK